MIGFMLLIKLLLIQQAKSYYYSCSFTDKLINDKVLRSSNIVNWSFDTDNFRFLYDNNNVIFIS